MTDRPWYQWYPQDWRGEDRLKLCSLAARGLWRELLDVMHFAEPRGHLVVQGRAHTEAEIATLVGAKASEVHRLLAELESHRVFSRTDDGVIYSRRMVRDELKHRRNSTNGGGGGNPNWKRGTVPKGERVKPLPHHHKQRVFPILLAECGGRCKVCGVELVYGSDAPADAPNFAHVDHIIPRSDGGTHEIENLRLLCRRCNHQRKELDPTKTPNQTPNPIPQVATPNAHAGTRDRVPESRDQKPETRKEREDAPALVRRPVTGSGVMAGALPRDHMRCQQPCGRVCMHQGKFAEFARRRGGPKEQADAYVRAWKERVDAKWDTETGPFGSVEISGKPWDFWDAAWVEDHPAAAVVSAKTAGNRAAAASWLAKKAGTA